MKKSRAYNGKITIGLLLNAIFINYAQKNYQNLNLTDAFLEIAKVTGYSKRNIDRLREENFIPQKDTVKSLALVIPEAEILNPNSIVHRLLVPDTTISHQISKIIREVAIVDLIIITTNIVKFTSILAPLVESLDRNKTIQVILADGESNAITSEAKNSLVKECLNLQTEEIDDIIGYIEDLSQLIDEKLDISTCLTSSILQDMILIDIPNIPIIGIKRISGFNMPAEVLEILKKDNEDGFDLSTSGYLYMPEEEIARAIEVFDIKTDT
jgi:hypothetical protein